MQFPVPYKTRISVTFFTLSGNEAISSLLHFCRFKKIFNNMMCKWWFYHQQKFLNFFCALPLSASVLLWPEPKWSGFLIAKNCKQLIPPIYSACFDFWHPQILAFLSSVEIKSFFIIGKCSRPAWLLILYYIAVWRGGSGTALALTDW